MSFNPFPDGVLVVDKPAGPTSHDVVAVVRRATRVKKVGHTGTLDPLAEGVLPIVLGRATRLAQFLSCADKEYEAEIALGASTTTFDRAGDALPAAEARPISDLTRPEIDAALAAFRGTFLQSPPTFSAKKVAGDRAYDLARQNESVVLRPVEVSVHALDLVAWSAGTLRLRLICSAGFYVRALAHDLGQRLRTGGHLASLRRTRSGDFLLSQAVPLGEVIRAGRAGADRVIPLRDLLPGLPALTLTAAGASLAVRGGFISAGHLSGSEPMPEKGRVRLMSPDGRLLAIAERRATRTSEFLHPGVVLE
jgi:tRNA pseudouridine55 synthase